MSGTPVPLADGVPRGSRATTGGRNGLAVVALVLGIAWLYWVGSLLALVLGYVARAQVRRGRAVPGDDSGDVPPPGRPVGPDGSGLALAAIVLGWLGLAGLVTFLVAGLVGPT